MIFPIAQSTELSNQNENAIKLANQLFATDGMTCEVCKIVFTNAKLLAKNKVKDKEVLLFVEKNLCGRLGEFNESCNKYLKTISETILALIEQDIVSCFSSVKSMKVLARKAQKYLLIDLEYTELSYFLF